MRRLTLVVAVLCCAAIGAAVAYKAHTRFDENKRCCLVPTARNISLSLREALRITRYQSEIGQDKWVAETIFPGITNGFFLDVGSGDGYMESNTQALEARGWKGICIDPFPRNMGGRTHVQYYGWALKNRAALMPSRAQVERATTAVEELRARHHGRIVIDAVPAFNAFRGTAWMKEPCASCPRRELDFGGCRCRERE